MQKQKKCRKPSLRAGKPADGIQHGIAGSPFLVDKLDKMVVHEGPERLTLQIRTPAAQIEILDVGFRNEDRRADGDGRRPLIGFDLAALLQPDRGEPATALHLVDKKSFEDWFKAQPERVRTALSARPNSCTSLNCAAHSRLVRSGGGPGRN